MSCAQINHSLFDHLRATLDGRELVVICEWLGDLPAGQFEYRVEVAGEDVGASLPAWLIDDWAGLEAAGILIRVGHVAGPLPVVTRTTYRLP